MCRSERYLGMWLEDKPDGAGMQVADNKYQYSGNYEKGERTVSDVCL